MFLMAAMRILFTKLGIKPHSRVGSFYAQDAEQTIPQLADGAHSLLASGRGLSWNQPQIAGALLAVPEPASIADGQHIRQCRHWPHAGLCHQQLSHVVLSRSN